VAMGDDSRRVGAHVGEEMKKNKKNLSYMP
jgi:hypothetical protein